MDPKTDALSQQLDRLYRLVLEANSDPDFYQAVYFYCDFVVNNPLTSKLLAEDQEYYATHHSAIWTKRSVADEDADKKEEATMNLERMSLYCKFSLILVRIYWPIDDLRKTIGHDGEQDPVALLMLRGIKKIKTKRWSKERLKMYNGWVEGKRPDYTNSLRRFHTQLVSSVGVSKDTAEEKVSLSREMHSFNARTGDFSINKTYVTFNPKSNEGKVFTLLYQSPDRQVTYLELIHAFRPHAEAPSKAYKDELSKVINSIKEKLGEERTIIQNVKGLGYRLVFPSPEENRE